MALYPSSRIDSLVAKNTRRIKHEFLAMLIAIREAYPLKRLTEIFASGQTHLLEERVRREAAVFADAVNQAYLLAGADVAAFATDKLRTRARFSVSADRVVRTLRDNELRLVSEFADSSRHAVIASLRKRDTPGVAAPEPWLHPREQAKKYLDSIGLTEKQQQHVANYRRQLQSGDKDAALRRSLRDKRMDARVARLDTEPLTEAEIDRMVAGYRKRYIRHRAESKATDEALRVVHEGDEEGFRQLAAEGKVDTETLLREWVTVGDTGVRPSHAALHGVKVKIGEPFISGAGNALRRPHDPQAPDYETRGCRCSVTTAFQAPVAKGDDMNDYRIVVVGGPRRGKSTYARTLGLPRYCTDPRSLCKEPEEGVTYLPEEFAAKDRWSDGSAYIAEHWFTMPGPWVIEGVATARALRKWLAVHDHPPCDRVVYFAAAHPLAKVTTGQERMALGVETVWRQVAYDLAHLTVEM